jgi:4-hydroxythreonine-4-phosphate dehydrogenase
MIKRIAITPGEPAGIGPDIAIAIAQQNWPVEIIVVASPQLLKQRAEQLGLPLTIVIYEATVAAKTHTAGCLKVLPIELAEPCVPGQLNPANGQYVVETLRVASTKKYQWRV